MNRRTLLVSTGEWVEVSSILIPASERSLRLPADTRRTPYVVRVRGFLEHAAHVGDVVAIRTLAGRQIHGTLVDARPRHRHDFGDPVPHLLRIDRGQRSQR